MSTCFEVHPRRLDDVTYGAVIERTTSLLIELLRQERIGVTGLELEWRYWPERGDSLVPEPDWPFVWGIECGYVFVSIRGVPGGTDITTFHDSPPVLDNPESWVDFLPQPTASIPDVEALLTYFRYGWCWSVRRSMGQPPLVAAMYGCLAAAVAELTDGVVWSDDGAMPSGLPAQRADEFRTWWFHPDRIEDPEFSQWCRASLDAIRAGVDGPVITAREASTMAKMADLGRPLAIVQPALPSAPHRDTGPDSRAGFPSIPVADSRLSPPPAGWPAEDRPAEPPALAPEPEPARWVTSIDVMPVTFDPLRDRQLSIRMAQLLDVCLQRGRVPGTLRPQAVGVSYRLASGEIDPRTRRLFEWTGEERAEIGPSGWLGCLIVQVASNSEAFEEAPPGTVADGSRTGWHWRIGRRVGQPPLVCVLQGCVASALAEATSGEIRLGEGLAGLPTPERAESFASWWFDPAAPISAPWSLWFEACLRAIRERNQRAVLSPWEEQLARQQRGRGERVVLDEPARDAAWWW